MGTQMLSGHGQDGVIYALPLLPSSTIAATATVCSILFRPDFAGFKAIEVLIYEAAS